MTVFMCVTLARNRATSNMPSATVFFVAYRFMFRPGPELPGTCSTQRGIVGSVTIRLYDKQPQDGSSSQRTPTPAAIRMLAPTTSRLLCVCMREFMSTPDKCKRTIVILKLYLETFLILDIRSHSLPGSRNFDVHRWMRAKQLEALT